jgi:hypothetical protein
VTDSGKPIRIVILASFLLCVSPVLAHHSFSAEYSISVQVVLKGQITTVEWANPHVFLTVAAKDSNGLVQDWRVEGGAVSVLKGSGWSAGMLRQMVKDRDTVTISGYRARSNANPVNGAWAKEIELPDGRKLPFN